MQYEEYRCLTSPRGSIRSAGRLVVPPMRIPYNATGTRWYEEVYYSKTGRRVLYERGEGDMHATYDLARREAEQRGKKGGPLAIRSSLGRCRASRAEDIRVNLEGIPTLGQVIQWAMPCPDRPPRKTEGENRHDNVPQRHGPEPLPGAE